MEKDTDKAISLFRRAVRQQSDCAASNLGECYKKGIGVEKNLKESLRYYRLAKRWCINLDKDELEKEINEVKEMIKNCEQTN